MKKERLRVILKERFMDYDGDYGFNTTFRIGEIPNGFRVQLLIESPTLWKRYDEYFPGFKYYNSVSSDFLKDIIERIELVGEFINYDVVFKSINHIQNFLLIKRT